MDENLTIDEIKERIIEGKEYQLKDDLRINGTTLIGTDRVLTLRDLERIKDKVAGRIAVSEAKGVSISSDQQKFLLNEFITVLKKHKNYKGLHSAKRKFVEQNFVNLVPHMDFTNYCLLNMQQWSKKLFYHSINVAIKALIIDLAWQRRHNKGLLDGLKSEVLIKGSLLHDIGIMHIKNGQNLVNQKRKDIIDSPEYKSHPEIGYQFLHDHREEHSLQPEVLRIVREHHESIDGSGFPNYLKGDRVHPYSQIVYIANELDLLLNGELTEGIRPFSQISRRIMALKNKVDKLIINNTIEEFRYLP